MKITLVSRTEARSRIEIIINKMSKLIAFTNSAESFETIQGSQNELFLQQLPSGPSFAQGLVYPMSPSIRAKAIKRKQRNERLYQSQLNMEDGSNRWQKLTRGSK